MKSSITAEKIIPVGNKKGQPNEQQSVHLCTNNEKECCSRIQSLKEIVLFFVKQESTLTAKYTAATGTSIIILVIIIIIIIIYFVSE